MLMRSNGGRFWKSGGIGEYMVKKDIILGHESSGVVVSVGSAVTNVKEGDRVRWELSTFRDEHC